MLNVANVTSVLLLQGQCAVALVEGLGCGDKRRAVVSSLEIWKARQESIRKKQVNPSENRAPVEGHLNLGGGVSLGWGAGGDERDQGGGARRAQKRGEG